MTPSVGDVLLGKYRVERLLGEGGMGVVFAVKHVALGEMFALKVLRAEIASDPAHLERFRREARAAASLRSDHVVRVTDAGELDDGASFLVMELVEGQTLLDIVRRRGSLPQTEAIRAALHAATGLAEAHARGIVHRDIKLSNLVLTRRPDDTPIVKVLDFGIAKVITPSADALTIGERVLGSPGYSSPEQVRDSRSVDARTDIWSLGVVLYEMLSGKLPFAAFTTPGVLARILTEEPERLETAVPSVPKALADVVHSCLQKEREARIADVVALAEALRPFAEDSADVERVLRVARALADPRRATTLSEEIAPAIPSARDVGTEIPTAQTQRPNEAETTVGERDDASAPEEDRSPRRRTTIMAAGMLILVATAAFAIVASRPKTTETPASASPTNVVPEASESRGIVVETPTTSASVTAASTPSAAPSASVSSAAPVRLIPPRTQATATDVPTGTAHFGGRK